MRLSLNQELRLVQKQVLAPRMIQSMEILQLPIMALQERIEQEIQENPVLEVRRRIQTGRRIGLSETRRMPTNTNHPTLRSARRTRIGCRRRPRQRRGLRASDRYGDSGPTHFEERVAVSRPAAWPKTRDRRKHDAMANMVARPQTLQDYLHDQLGWFDLAPTKRKMCERIIYNLDANGYLQGSLEDLLAADASDGRHSGTRRAGAGDRPATRSPGRRGARPARMLAVAAHAGDADSTRNSRRLIGNHLEDIEAQSLPVISKQDRLFARAHSKSRWEELQETESQARGRVQEIDVCAAPSCPMCFSIER